MARHVDRQRFGDASANEMDAPLRIGQHGEDRIEFSRGQSVERAGDIFRQCADELGKARARRRNRRLARERRLDLRFQFLFEAPLKIGVSIEAEAGDKAEDRWRGNARAFGELADRLQSAEGIVRQESVRSATLAWRKFANPQPNLGRNRLDRLGRRIIAPLHDNRSPDKFRFQRRFDGVGIPWIFVSAIADKIARLAGYIGLAPSFTAFLDWTLALRSELDVPHALKGLKVNDAMFSAMAKMAPTDPTAGGNPVKLTERPAEDLYRRAYEGTV